MSPVMAVQSPNHGTARAIPGQGLSLPLFFQLWKLGLRDNYTAYKLVDLFLKPSDLLLVQLGFEPRSILHYYCSKISIFIRVNF